MQSSNHKKSLSPVDADIPRTNQSAGSLQRYNQYEVVIDFRSLVLMTPLYFKLAGC